VSPRGPRSVREGAAQFAGGASERIGQLAQQPQRHIVLQLDRPATAELRAALSAAGVTCSTI
jgi:hypothetical protein